MSHAELLPLGVTAVMLPELDFDEQIELCRRLGVTHYVYRPRQIPDNARDKPWSNWGNHKFDLTPARLRDEGAELAGRLRQAGLVPWTTVPRLATDIDDEQELEVHLAGAAAGGCPSVRVMPTPYPRGELFDYDAYLPKARQDLARVVERAGDHGLKVVIEMHVGTTACSPGLARLLVEEFDPARLGVILDLPNHASEGAISANLAISVLRDWIDHCHIGGARRTQGEYDALGFRNAGRLMCPITEGDLHIPTWLNLLGQLGRPVPLVIEDYTPNVPGPLRLESNATALQRALGVAEPAST